MPLSSDPSARFSEVLSIGGEPGGSRDFEMITSLPLDKAGEKGLVDVLGGAGPLGLGNPWEPVQDKHQETCLSLAQRPKRAQGQSLFLGIEE